MVPLQDETPKRYELMSSRGRFRCSEPTMYTASSCAPNRCKLIGKQQNGCEITALLMIQDHLPIRLK